jgi:hypothetical protein
MRSRRDLLLLGAAVVLLAIVLGPGPFIARTTAISYSIDDAVRAGAEHTRDVTPAPPDESRAVGSAKNLVSVPFMARGYCRAGSWLTDTEALGGFAKSDNAAKRVQTRSQGSGLFLIAQPGVVTLLPRGQGMRLALVNRTDELLAFDASDSRLAIVQEAQATDGKWKPIEYLPASDCGNSYHRVFLPPDHFWAFSAPRYKGTLATKLRFAMTMADGSQLYSNVFQGSVNPEQFTEKQGYDGKNIMDP